MSKVPLYSILSFIIFIFPLFAQSTDSKNPAQLLSEGNTAFDQNNYQIAISKFEQAIALLDLQKDKKTIADTTYKLGTAYSRVANYKEALKVLNNAREMHEELGDKDGAGFDSMLIALNHVWQGEYDLAMPMAQKILETFKTTGNKKGIAKTYRVIAVTHHYLAEYQSAIDFFQKGLELSREVGDKETEGLILRDYGAVYWIQGDFDQALEFYDKALQIAEELKNPRLVSSILGNRGLVYWHQGDLPKAVDDFEHCNTLFQQTGDQGSLATNYLNLGSVQIDLGNYREAEALLQKSLEISIDVKDRGLEGSCLHSLGRLHAELRNYDIAINYVQKSLRVLQEIGEKREETYALMVIGTVHERLEKYQQALEFYEKARSIYEETGEKKGIASSLSRIGVIYAKLGKHDLAMGHYTKALGISESIGYKLGIGDSLTSIASEYYNEGKMIQAEETLMRSIPILREIGRPDLLWPALHELGLVLRDSNRVEEAVQNVKEAVDVIEKVRGKIDFAEQKSGYLEDKLEVYEDLIQLLLSQQNIADAFAYAQRSKARAFLDLLVESRIDPEGALKPEFLDQKRKFLTQLVSVEKNIDSEYEKEKINPATIQNLKNKRSKLEEQYSKLVLEIRNSNPRFADLQYPHPLKMEEAQALLNQETILLEFVTGETKSEVFAITAKESHVYEIPNEAKLSKKIKELRDTLQKPENVWQVSEQAHSRYVKAAFNLYLDLVKPVAAELQGKRRIIIAPDGPLNYLPFECLLTKKSESISIDFRKLPYFARDFDIQYVPSVSVLAALQKNQDIIETSKQKALLALADPFQPANHVSDAILPGQGTAPTELPYARKEIKSIAQFYPGSDVTLLIGKQASEENIKEFNLADYNKIHIACHGWIDEDRPQLSALLLSAQSHGKEDGYLTMREIFDLKLQADLVVLSACKTGLGQRIRGEGITGLSRAFICAGTSSVLVSLWDVYDESTSDLMTSFYQNIRNRNISKAQALKEARLQMITSEKYSHPYYWSPFILIGKQ